MFYRYFEVTVAQTAVTPLRPGNQIYRHVGGQRTAPIGLTQQVAAIDAIQARVDIAFPMGIERIAAATHLECRVTTDHIGQIDVGGDGFHCAATVDGQHQTGQRVAGLSAFIVDRQISLAHHQIVLLEQPPHHRRARGWHAYHRELAVLVADQVHRHAADQQSGWF